MLLIVFCSWSGGKESTLALQRAIEMGLNIDYLVNMVPKEGSTVGHGLSPEFYSMQAKSMQIKIKQKETDWEEYEESFSDIIRSIDADQGIFGDVYLPDHRGWVEDKSEELGFKPLEPLWNQNTEELYREYLDKGFEGMIVKVKPEKVPEKWLGKTLDEEFLNFLKDNDICPLGEGGEYHTATLNGPIFKNRIKVELGGKKKYGNGKIIELEDQQLV